MRREKSRDAAGASKGEMLCFRLTDEQNLYSVVELCRGAGGGNQGSGSSWWGDLRILIIHTCILMHTSSVFGLLCAMAAEKSKPKANSTVE